MFTYTRNINTGTADLSITTVPVNTSAAAITSSAANQYTEAVVVITTTAEVTTSDFGHKYRRR